MSQPPEYRIKKLDVQHAPNMDHIVIIGKRATGKSTLARDIVSTKYPNIPGVVVDPSNPNHPHPYASLVPSPIIHNESLNEEQEIIKCLLERQKLALQKQLSDNAYDPRAYLVLDSCFYVPRWSQHPSMRKLLTNSRQLHTSIIITLQYPSRYENMDSADYVFMFKERSTSERRRFFDYFGGIFPDYATFESILDQCTSDPYSCLVISTHSTSTKLEDHVFWYKVDPNM